MVTLNLTWPGTHTEISVVISLVTEHPGILPHLTTGNNATPLPTTIHPPPTPREIGFPPTLHHHRLQQPVPTTFFYPVAPAPT
eukprot:scaffold8634_cov115-Isochrysis_galbana.AAC.14